jgi:hypothetical protein
MRVFLKLTHDQDSDGFVGAFALELALGASAMRARNFPTRGPTTLRELVPASKDQIGQNLQMKFANDANRANHAKYTKDHFSPSQ